MQLSAKLIANFIAKLIEKPHYTGSFLSDQPILRLSADLYPLIFIGMSRLLLKKKEKTNKKTLPIALLLKCVKSQL